MTICMASGWRYLQATRAVKQTCAALCWGLAKTQAGACTQQGTAVHSILLRCTLCVLLQCSISVWHRRSAIAGASAALLDVRKRRKPCSHLPLVRVEADNNEDRLHLQG